MVGILRAGVTREPFMLAGGEKDRGPPVACAVLGSEETPFVDDVGCATVAPAAGMLPIEAVRDAPNMLARRATAPGPEEAVVRVAGAAFADEVVGPGGGWFVRRCRELSEPRRRGIFPELSVVLAADTTSEAEADEVSGLEAGSCAPPLLDAANSLETRGLEPVVGFELAIEGGRIASVDPEPERWARGAEGVERRSARVPGSCVARYEPWSVGLSAARALETRVEAAK